MLRGFIFPGQGSQFPGMGKDWYENFKESRDVFEEASDFSGLHLKKLCFESDENELKKTQFTQPAILCVSLAIWQALKERMPLEGIHYMGHSLGEYSALAAAGVLPFGAAVKLVHLRGKYMQEAVAEGQGAMAALLFRDEPDAWNKTQKFLTEFRAQGKNIWAANDNNNDQVVVSGAAKDFEEFEKLAPTKIGARRVIKLAVSAPFHCPMMQKAADLLAEDIKRVHLQAQPEKFLITNTKAELLELSQVELLPAMMQAQVVSPVLWRQSIEKLLQQNVNVAFEVGAGSVLQGLAKRILFNNQTLKVWNFSKVSDFENFMKTEGK